MRIPYSASKAQGPRQGRIPKTVLSGMFMLKWSVGPYEELIPWLRLLMTLPGQLVILNLRCLFLPLPHVEELKAPILEAGYLFTPPRVRVLSSLWPLLDGIWGSLKGIWGVLVSSHFGIPISAFALPSRPQGSHPRSRFSK